MSEVNTKIHALTMEAETTNIATGIQYVHKQLNERGESSMVGLEKTPKLNGVGWALVQWQVYCFIMDNITQQSNGK